MAYDEIMATEGRLFYNGNPLDSDLLFEVAGIWNDWEREEQSRRPQPPTRWQKTQWSLRRSIEHARHALGSAACPHSHCCD